MGARLRGAGVGARGAEARKLIRSRASAYACSVINPCLNSALSWLIGVSISLIITTLRRSICLVCVYISNMKFLESRCQALKLFVKGVLPPMPLIPIPTILA